MNGAVEAADCALVGTPDAESVAPFTLDPTRSLIEPLGGRARGAISLTKDHTPCQRPQQCISCGDTTTACTPQAAVAAGMGLVGGGGGKGYVWTPEGWVCAIKAK